MALDYSKLSDAELEAIANNDYSKLSDDTLNAIAAEPQTTESAKEDLVVPAVGAALPGSTGLKDLANKFIQASQPMIDAGKTAAAGYARSPGKAIVDVGAAHLGLPPPYATYEAYQGGKGLLNAAGQTATNIGEALGRLPAGTDQVAKAFINELKPADFARFNDLVNKQGVEQAFKTYQPPAYLGESATQSLNAVREAFPSTMQKIGQTMAPFVRAASKVAAPVGAAVEGVQGVQQARQGDLTGAALSGMGAASMFNPAGLLAQPGLGMMQSANRNFRQQTPDQQKESSMAALSGAVPGMAGEYSTQSNMDDRLRMAIRLKAAKKVLGQP
jgi:hypothetical protein